jgi:hypothetical protein
LLDSDAAIKKREHGHDTKPDNTFPFSLGSIPDACPPSPPMFASSFISGFSGGMIGSPPSSPMQIDHVPQGRVVCEQNSQKRPPIKMRKTFSSSDADNESSCGGWASDEKICPASDTSPLPHLETGRDALTRISSETVSARYVLVQHCNSRLF